MGASMTFKNKERIVNFLQVPADFLERCLA